MTEVESIYPTLPSDLDTTAVDAIEKLSMTDNVDIPNKDIDSNDVNNNSTIGTNDQKLEDNLPDATIETENTYEIEKPSNTTNIFRDVLAKCKIGNKPEDKQKLRNVINDDFILKTAVEVNDGNIDTILKRGDFFIARRIWDKTEGKFHDHFVFVKERFVKHGI